MDNFENQNLKKINNINERMDLTTESIKLLIRSTDDLANCITILTNKSIRLENQNKTYENLIFNLRDRIIELEQKID